MYINCEIVDHNKDWLIINLSNTQFETCNFFFKYNKNNNKIKKNYKTKKNYIFILPLFIALIISILLNIKVSNDNLYNKYYIPYRQDVYRTTQIVKPNEYFEKSSTIEHFFVASSFQNNENYKEAIEEYKIVINNNDNIFVEEAEWYMALCYLKLNNTENAYKEFKKIYEQKGYYKSNAKTIMKKMRK